MAGDSNAARALGDPYSPHGMLLRAQADVDLVTGQVRQLLLAATRSVTTTEDALDCLRATAVLMSGLVDTWSLRLASGGGDPDPNEAYDRAEDLIAKLDLAPTGVETAADPEYAARLRQCTANLLARHWVNGMLLGVHDTDAWPNADLIQLLQPAVERHADMITLLDEIDHLDDEDD